MPVKATGPTQDALMIGSWFTVELDNGITSHFTDASGLSVELEVVEVNDSSKDTRSIKRPGVPKYGDITLKRSMSADKKFWEWAKSIRNGTKDFRTGGAIVMHDITGAETGRWTFTSAWPSKWSASDLDVGTDDVMTEEIVLAVELLQRTK